MNVVRQNRMEGGGGMLGTGTCQLLLFACLSCFFLYSLLFGFVSLSISLSFCFFSQEHHILVFYCT